MILINTILRTFKYECEKFQSLQKGGKFNWIKKKNINCIKVIKKRFTVLEKEKGMRESESLNKIANGL